MSAITTSLAGLLGARKRFEASASRVVASGAGTAHAGTDAASGGAGAGTKASAAGGQAAPGPAATGPGGVRLSPDLAGAMIDMLSAGQSFKANAAVAGRIAETEREVIDALAPDRPR